MAVGQGPACAKACPTQAIVFGTKDEMKEWAAGRIEDLKSRGFANAGLYDPPGVGGTHVMYVLQHADQPSLYAGLPDDPRISPVVEAWKGVTKYAGLTAIGAFAAIGFLHHLVSGANRVTEHDEEEAKRLAEREEAHDRRIPTSPAATRSTGATRSSSTATPSRRGSTTGSPPSAWCCWRSPASRCSTRACSS